MKEEQTKSYWVQVFTENTWRVFLEKGGDVTGFSESRWSYIQQMRPGDTLLCYLSKVSKWVGILTVLSEPYLDTSRIWTEKLFPCRANVSVVAKLPLEKALPVQDLRDKVSILNRPRWSLYFISSPRKWKPQDGEIIESAILEAAGKTGAQRS